MPAAPVAPVSLYVAGGQGAVIASPPNWHVIASPPNWHVIASPLNWHVIASPPN